MVDKSPTQKTSNSRSSIESITLRPSAIFDLKQTFRAGASASELLRRSFCVGASSWELLRGSFFAGASSPELTIATRFVGRSGRLCAGIFSLIFRTSGFNGQQFGEPAQ